MEKRYKFFKYKAPGETGVTFQEIDGLARPVGGVCFCPGQTFGGKAPEEFHHGWLCTPPDSAGRAMPHPASSEEEALYAEKMVFRAESASKKLRRRIEDRLRKGSVFVALRYCEGNEGIFSVKDIDS